MPRPSASPPSTSTASAPRTARAWASGSTARDVDILALQEVRAETDDLDGAARREWDVLHDAATAKGRAGRRDRLAAARRRSTASTSAPTTSTAPGRWLEADYDVDGTILTVVSAYVHSGEVGTPEAGREVQVPRRDGRAAARARARTTRSPSSIGDLNVGHRTLDIKNWKGNAEARRLPARGARATSTGSSAPEDDADYNAGAGLGWVDVGRRFAGEVRRPVHVVVAARAGVRQRHRLAHRLPARLPRARGASPRLRGRPRGDLRDSDGPTTRPSSSTTHLLSTQTWNAP